MNDTESVLSTKPAETIRPISDLLKDSAPQIKKKRGPKGPWKHKKVSTDSATIEPTTKTAVENSTMGEVVSPSNPPASPIPVEVLKEAVKFPFNLGAEFTGFDGWKLEDASSDVLAAQADTVLKTKFPNISNDPNLCVYMFIGTAVSIGLIKYRMYKMWLAEKEKKARDESQFSREAS